MNMDSCPSCSPSAGTVAPPAWPWNPPPSPQQLPPSVSSVDEELARAATESLSMGPATVDAPGYNFALPKTLHRGLYEITLGDASVTVPGNSSGNNNTNNSNNHSGVPGFPDFPDFWVGESSGGQKKHTNTSTNKNAQVPKRRMSGCSVDAAIDDDLARRISTLFAQARARGRDRTISKSKRRQQQRRMVRKAVNVPYGSSSSSRTGNSPGGVGAGKELKRRLKDQRRLKRIEMVVKLQEKRRRKRQMGEICRGMASIKCK
mmetsp:Transcript_903/g.2057  ORF Transcript_903/g.2057 Transcript_903/m.2057 type:complete len:261 (-) Transcript_903:20-802(-)